VDPAGNRSIHNHPNKEIHMRTIPLLVVACSLTLAVVAQANDNMIVKKSAHNVATTMDRFEAGLKEKGITVVARVNHAGGAKKVGLELRPTELILFANPKLGTPLMQSNQRAGIDLPLKALVWEDDKRQTWIGYVAPSAIANAHGIRDRDEVVTKMAGVLDALSTQATSR
jgi:uncharacterized protein (DUF302 family)